MNKYIKKMIFSILAVTLSTSVLTMNVKPIEAATYNVQERFLGQWRAVAGNTGLWGNGTVLTVNGEIAFCLQANKGAVTGNNYLINFSDIGIDQNKERRLSLIKNFGFMAQQSETTYMLTTNLLWRELGYTCYYVSPQNGFPTWESMQPWMNDVLNKVNSYQTGVSFERGNFEVNVGETVALTDTNNVLQNMQVDSNDGLQVSINGNQLLVTGTSNANDNATIILKKGLASGQEGGTFVVRKGNSQAVSILKTTDPQRSKVHFKVNKNYSVAFDGNDATSGSMTNQLFVPGQEQTLKDNAYVKVGHTFTGWNTAADGSGTDYTDKQVVKDLTSPNTSITLYAKWLANKYNVAFNGNGSARGSMDEQTFIYNQEQALSINAFTKLGHTFDGWNTAADGSGTNYTNEQVVKNLTSENGGKITMYAKWINTVPELDTPVLPNPLPPTNSNLPPILEGDKLVVQLGDKLDVVDYFKATDKEDGNITSKVVITNNPVPLDKNLNTIKSGDYVVTAKVTDLGGLSATANLAVHVNEPPVIKAEDRWFLQDQAVDRTTLLEQVIATDKEDGDLHSKVEIDWIKYHDGRVVKNPTDFDTTFVNETGVDDIKYTISEVQYTVKDKYQRSATTKAKLHIARDIQKFVPKTKKYIRYINLENIGTLAKNSRWRNDPEYNKILINSLSKTDKEQAKCVISFTHKEVLEIKGWLRSNPPSQHTLHLYVEKYLKPNIVRGGLD